MTMLTPDGFMTLADAVQNAVSIAEKFDFKRINDQQNAHESRLEPSHDSAESATYDDATNLLVQSQTVLEIGYWWKWPDRLQNWWAWLRRELFVGSLEARSYSTSGDFHVIAKEFWGSQAAEYVYVTGDMSIAGTRPAYGPAFVSATDLSRLIANSLTGHHGVRPGPPEQFLPINDEFPVRSAQVKLILSANFEPGGVETSATPAQGSPGAPRRFDGEQLLIEAFRILWEGPTPPTRAKLTELALDVYVKKGLQGGVPTGEWAKPKIRKLWVALGLDSNSRD